LVEVAAIEAFTYAFPTVKKAGCFFHSGQFLWRKFVEVGLKEENGTKWTLKTLRKTNLLKLQKMSAFL
jgi:hypothetical protein